MFATTARRSSAVLLFAALQFVVLTGIAMQLYPGYRFSAHFFSDLGATRTWAGAPNHASAAVFAITVAIVGIAMVVFAGAWRDYAFSRGRGERVGRASHVCGTISGVAFFGVACAPMNVVLDLHNLLVVIAFGMLLAFAACMTAVWWKNDAPRAVLIAGSVYLLVLVGFFAAVTWVVATDLVANLRVIVIGQKIAIYSSMTYVVFLTLTIRGVSR